MASWKTGRFEKALRCMPLATIAIAYRVSTAATTICALEAAGFKVFSPSFHIANTVPHYALAIGGIGIAVPAVDSAEALELLHSFSASPPTSGTLGGKVLNGLGWAAFGVSTPWPDLLLMERSISSA
ncbi:hypothetical protein [Ruegeria arenilitoris]|uniref:hypothetical protein n=2 Tax=Ruegeria arenilitoris TaxID=1173585 RepID=UPI00147ADEFD|nr:hypothetical protein [Ruegeria arenilitoris]